MAVQLRIADTQISVDGAEITVTAQINLGSYTESADGKLKVQRDGTEEMQIKLKSLLTDQQASYVSG